MRYVNDGQRVQLTPAAAERYGMSKDQVFTVLNTYPDPKYKKFWVRLAELDAPLNTVKPSDLRIAKEPTK
jgi:hypothetical protein